ncbi:MAG TPA: isocitrate/isopropylmalate family dehydrogenase, partial [Fimbriimonas sp.]|nr:isocitrate/isopropylmalate family dehydrogenase [Fimbriimonas sp.]
MPIYELMSKKKIGVIPGDGIGPEITDATISILEAVGFEAEWVFLEGGLGSVEKGQDAMPQKTIDAIRELGIALKGPTTTPVGKGHKSANVILRQELDLFANVRPTKTMPGLHGPFEDKKIDLIIVRENTEDLYAGIEFQAHPDVAQSIKVITRPGCQRLFK